MRTRLLFLFLAFTALSNAQSKDTIRKYLDKDFEFTNKAGMVYKAVVYPVQDKWMLVASYPDASTLITATFKDRATTVKDGPFSIYYSNGVRALAGNFADNQREGIWASWFTNGNLKDSGAISGNAMTGAWFYGHENGKAHIKAEFVKMSPALSAKPVRKKSFIDFSEVASVKNGQYQSWYKDGTRKDSGSFENGQRKGYWNFWHENGQVESTGFFADSKTIYGDWVFYRDDGSISTRERYRDNKLVSLTCFNEKGDSTGNSCSIAKLPVFLGSPYDWKMYIDRSIQWSKETVRNNDNGVVGVRLTIGKDGRITKYVFDGGAPDLVRQDIERVIKGMTNWSPAVLHNREFEYTLQHTVGYSFR